MKRRSAGALSISVPSLRPCQNNLFQSVITAQIFCICLFCISPAHAKKTCDYIKKPPLKVNVTLTTPEIAYNYTKTAQQMSSERFDDTVQWLQKNGIRSAGIARHLGQFMSVRGLASGGYAYSMSYRMRAEPVDRYGVYYCPYLTEVNIEFFYATQIFIAKEIPKGTCEFNETMKHEWEHHKANLMAVQKYSDRIKQDLPKMAREIELRHGHISSANIDQTFGEIKKSVADMVNIYYEFIEKESRERNDFIDSPAEYARVDHAIQTCEKTAR